jgi:lipopolysaccharide exporter
VDDCLDRGSYGHPVFPADRGCAFAVDFGLMAMVMAVLGFAQIFTDMGVGGAIIHRQENSPNELSSLFWLNVSAGAVIFLLLVAATPLIVAFFDEPRLASLLPTMAVLCCS